MDKKIEDRQIVDFSKLINSWQYLRPFLGMSDADESSLKNDYTADNQKMNLLFMWKKRKGSDATLIALKQACEEAREYELARKIQKLYGGFLATPIAATYSSELSYQYDTEPVDEIGIAVATDHQTGHHKRQPPSLASFISTEKTSIYSNPTVTDENLSVHGTVSTDSPRPHPMTHSNMLITSSNALPSTFGGNGTRTTTHTTNLSKPIAAETNKLIKLFKTNSADIKDFLQNDIRDFSNRLQSASLIDSAVARRIHTTHSYSNFDKASELVDSVEAKLVSVQDPTNEFIEVCNILKRYDMTKEIAKQMLSEGGFDLVEENITNAAAPTKLVSIKESIKDYEDIKYDFSKFSNTQRYGEPTLPQLLNWIVADNPDVWNEVGTQLNIPSGQLSGIKMDISLGGKPALMFKEVLVLWKRSRSKPYNWQTILDVLVSKSVNLPDNAHFIVGKLTASY